MSKIEGILKFLERFEIYNLLVSLILTYFEYWVRWIPTVDVLPFKENNTYITAIIVVSINLLLIKIAEKTMEFINHIYRNYQNNCEFQKIKERQHLESMNKLWNLVAELTPNNHSVVMQLFLTENEPILTVESLANDSIYLNKYFISKSFCRNEKAIENFNKRYTFDLANQYGYFVEESKYSKIPEYRLTNDFYSLLKQSYIEFGKISTFDSEKEQLAESGLLEKWKK